MICGTFLIVTYCSVERDWPWRLLGLSSLNCWKCSTFDFANYALFVIFLCFCLQFSGFRCHFGTSRPLEQLLGDPKRTLSTVFPPLREHIGSGLTSACNVAGHTHRLPCRFFGSAPIVMQRNPKFSTINADDITKFKEILGEKNVVQDEERLLAANTDWMRKYKGSSTLVLQPRTTEEVYIFLSCEIVASWFTICCVRISFPYLLRLFWQGRLSS